MPYPDNTAVKDALLQDILSRNQPNSMNTRSLLMFSGGLDSVALLWNLLQHTEQKLHVHHIEICNFENRDRAENMAIDRVMEYVKDTCRDFDYSVSANIFNLGKGGGLDQTLALFTASRVVAALGGTETFVYTGHIQPALWEMQEGAAVFNACFIGKRWKPLWLTPLSHVAGGFQQRKVNIYESMPQELADMTWSCRKPVWDDTDTVPTPCGTCHACKGRQAIKNAIENNDL